MFRLSSFIVTLLVASVLPHCSYGILEDELTAALREFLAPYDPYTINNLTDVPVVTDHSDVLLNANVIPVTGFGEIVVTFFEPPIPLISNEVRIETTSDWTWHTDDYTIVGTFNGGEVAYAGKADLFLEGFAINVDFTSDTYSLDPLSVCVDPGSLVIDLTVRSVDAEFEGADDINQDIDANPGLFVDMAEAYFNSISEEIEGIVNGLLCV
ncbi:uncharacterized protein [Procambarus clarkii]|uniref:uncharacterized protein n=1 Tax=Procambarus clarkii TaxID=6728 RepID=UPI001E6750B8|nr:uncharacterized protein LOC123767723 [Procambarus clarkii]